MRASVCVCVFVWLCVHENEYVVCISNPRHEVHWTDWLRWNTSAQWATVLVFFFLFLAFSSWLPPPYILHTLVRRVIVIVGCGTIPTVSFFQLFSAVAFIFPPHLSSNVCTFLFFPSLSPSLAFASQYIHSILSSIVPFRFFLFFFFCRLANSQGRESFDKLIVFARASPMLYVVYLWNLCIGVLCTFTH